MDRKYIDDHHVVPRYLADQLTAAEREEFEAQHLEDPQIVRELEATACFKAGLMQLRDTGVLDRLPQPAPWYRKPRFIAAAATLAALGIAIGYLAQRSPAAQPLLVAAQSQLQTWRGQPLAIGSTHTIRRTRSGSYDAEIEAAASAQSIELHVLPEFEAQPPRYSISVLRADEKESPNLARIDGLAPSADGFVTVYLNGARLEPGRYELRIVGGEGASAATESSAFLINVRGAAR